MRPRRLLCLSVLAACDWDLNRMNDQPRCEPGDRTPWLPDARCDQPAPAGTIAWRTPATMVAPPRSRATIERGRDRFMRVCAPCHGWLGDGASVIAADMVLRPPPSLLSPVVRGYPDQRLFEVISMGYGLMPAYTYQLSPADRWAIVQYVRVLALSQTFPVASIPSARREEAARWLR